MLEKQHLSGRRPVSGAGDGRDLRLDIEGMRALAVGSVLAFHVGLPWFAGGFVGVDVFFVLSGFLITGLLSREVSRTGRVRLATFWARRAKRLLPASATVLVFSAVMTYLVLPVTQRATFGGDVVSAALYVVNWRLADRSVDYLAEDIGVSPVQHYWSLSVEEQFYLVWPLLMLLVAVGTARRWRLGSFVVLTLVTATSFAWSVVQSEGSPDTAFFVTTTRIWELGVGALLALAASRIDRVPAILRAAGGWLGIAAIGYAVLVFDGSTTWPGIHALVPVVGSAMMIASGIVVTPGSPQRLLSLAPMVWIGGLSYSLYLWHWPILVAAQVQFDDLRTRYTLLLVLFSVVPAWLCHRFIENPVRFGTPFKQPRRALGLGAALTVLGVVVGLALQASTALITSAREASVTESVGARALDVPENAGRDWSDLRSVDAMRPRPVDAPKDRPPQYDNQPECQVKDGNATPAVCEFGDTSADRTVLIVGDSKIVQWQPVLSAIGEREGWRLLQVTKSACPFTDAEVPEDNRKDCRAWGKAALQKILDIRPDLVITSHRPGEALPQGTTKESDVTRAAMVNGMKSYWSSITGAGIPVVALLDNPSPADQPVYECVARHADDLARCSFDKATGVADSGAPSQREAADAVSGVTVMDLTDTVCPDRLRCAPVIGNVLVYRQTTHVTRTYVDSAVRPFAAALSTATGGGFGSG